MRLIDLQPRWLSENVFVFKCPHCVRGGREQPYWLSCKNVPMKISDQFELWHASGLEGVMVPMNEATAWKFSGKDFETLSVTPSIDASPSGDWHGYITNGGIR